MKLFTTTTLTQLLWFGLSSQPERERGLFFFKEHNNNNKKTPLDSLPVSTQLPEREEEEEKVVKITDHQSIPPPAPRPRLHPRATTTHTTLLLPHSLADSPFFDNRVAQNKTPL